MESCPFCEQPLSAEDVASRKCSLCGATWFARPVGKPRELDPDERRADTAIEGDVDAEQSADESAIPEKPSDAESIDAAGLTQTYELNAPESGGGTLPDPDVELTIDSVPYLDDVESGPGTEATIDSVDVPRDSGTGSEDVHSGVTQTLDSKDVPQPVGGKPPTVAEQRDGRTLDSDELSSREKQRILEIWGSAADEGSPGMTLKDSVSGRDQLKTSLVIQPRAFSRKSQGTPTTIATADYEMLDLLGKGGMAVVYAARQASVDRVVAVKMLKPSLAKDKRQRHKFLSEAVVTGDLEHPNIVPIYDLGSDDRGALFYSMKRVRGTRWLDVIRSKPQSYNLEIWMRVADAVAFAHSRGVIHRDLKPENVMLGDFGEVLVMDWGLAVATSDYTKSGNVVQEFSMGGTPAYMAPEMATGRIEKIGPAGDIYLMGAILYELITGKQPHRGKDTMACLYAAAQNKIEPTDKSGELLEIAMRAMATDPKDRFNTVRDMQDAVRIYQSHSESISLAQRSEEDLSNAEQSKDYRDYARAMYGFEEAVELWDGNRRARQGLIHSQLAYARCGLAKDDLDLAASLLREDCREHTELLAEIRRAQRERDLRLQRLKTAKRLTRGLVAAIVLIVSGSFVWILLAMLEVSQQRDIAKKGKEDAEFARGVAQQKHTEAERARVVAVQERDLADDAMLTAVEQFVGADEARADAVQQRGQAVEAREQAEYQAYTALIGVAAAQIEENAFAAARATLEQCSAEHRGWEWRRLMFLCDHDARHLNVGTPLAALDLAATRGWVAVGKQAGFEIRDANTWELQAEVDLDPGCRVSALAFSPDNRWLAIGCTAETNAAEVSAWLSIWDVENQQFAYDLPGHSGGVLSVSFSADGGYLLSSSYDKTARVWDLSSQRAVYTLVGHRSWVWDARFSPTRPQVVTASQDGTALVWTLSDRGQVLVSPAFRGHQGPVYTVAFSPTGDEVASAGYDGQLLVWPVDELREFQFAKVIQNEVETPDQPFRDEVQLVETLRGHTAAVTKVRYLGDGQLIASTSRDNTVNLWHVDRGQLFKSFRGHGGWVSDCAVDAENKWLYTTSEDGTLRAWNIDGYHETRVLDARTLQGHSDAILQATYNRSGDRIVTASRDRTAIQWDAAAATPDTEFREGHRYLASRVVFMPRTRRLLTSAIDNTTRVWDQATGTELFVLEQTGLGAAAAVSHDERWLATGSAILADDRYRIRLFSAADGQLITEIGDHRGPITALRFSSDDQWLAAGDHLGRCSLWRQSEDGWQAVPLPSIHAGRITGLAFLPDGQRLLSSSSDRTVIQWSLPTGQAVAERTLRHPEAVSDMALSRDGRTLITSAEDGFIRVWMVDAAEVVRQWQSPDSDETVDSIALAGTNDLLLTVASNSGTVRLWHSDTGQQVLFRQPDQTLGALIEGAPSRLVWSATIAEDGSLFATVGGNLAQVWPLPAPEMALGRAVDCRPQGPLASADYSHDGSRLVTGSWDFSARIWDTANGKALLPLKGGHSDRMTTALFSHHDRWVATAGNDGRVILWDSESGEIIARWQADAVPQLCLAFSDDDRWIYAGGGDGLIRIYPTDGGEPGEPVKVSENEVLAVAVREHRLVAGCGDNQAVLLDLDSRQRLATLAGHSAAVTGVAWTSDGTRIATASADLTAKIWDPASQRVVLTLRGHEKELSSVAFAPDDSSLLTASRDGTALVWPVKR